MSASSRSRSVAMTATLRELVREELPPERRVVVALTASAEPHRVLTDAARTEAGARHERIVGAGDADVLPTNVAGTFDTSRDARGAARAGDGARR
jgi:hypothetical protein